MKKEITRDEYLAGLGLYTLMKEAWRTHKECENAMLALFDMNNEEDGGWLFESVINDAPFDELVKKKYKITVSQSKEGKMK